MIAKPFELPYNVLQLHAMERRGDPTHPMFPYVQKDLINWTKGYKGEHSLEYFLRMLPDKTYYIFYQLRLEENKQSFQLDLLLVSSKLIVILEVKTMGGTLFFDTNGHQLIQKIDNKEYTYQCPINQVNLQEYHLRRWLKENKFPDIPIISLVVCSKPSSKIETNDRSKSFFDKVIHAHYLPTKISKVEANIKLDILNHRELKSLVKSLLKKHIPLENSILEKYNMSDADLLKGVFCPSCSFLPMIKQKKSWFCSKCLAKSRTAHIDALKDFYFIHGNKITNSQARDFLMVDSPYVAKRILQSMDLEYEGEKKSRIYRLKF